MTLMLLRAPVNNASPWLRSAAVNILACTKTKESHAMCPSINTPHLDVPQGHCQLCQPLYCAVGKDGLGTHQDLRKVKE
eukprot:1161538-Pelagomonas_calceolata.AAC.11